MNSWIPINLGIFKFPLHGFTNILVSILMFTYKLYTYYELTRLKDSKTFPIRKLSCTLSRESDAHLGAYTNFLET